MDILKATKRTTVTTGQINKLRSEGFIPAVLYFNLSSDITSIVKDLKNKLLS